MAMDEEAEPLGPLVGRKWTVPAATWRLLNQGVAVPYQGPGSPPRLTRIMPTYAGPSTARPPMGDRDYGDLMGVPEQLYPPKLTRTAIPRLGDAEDVSEGQPPAAKTERRSDRLDGYFEGLATCSPETEAQPRTPLPPCTWRLPWTGPDEFVEDDGVSAHFDVPRQVTHNAMNAMGLLRHWPDRVPYREGESIDGISPELARAVGLTPRLSEEEKARRRQRNFKRGEVRARARLRRRAGGDTLAVADLPAPAAVLVTAEPGPDWIAALRRPYEPPV